MSAPRKRFGITARVVAPLVVAGALAVGGCWWLGERAVGRMDPAAASEASGVMSGVLWTVAGCIVLAIAAVAFVAQNEIVKRLRELRGVMDALQRGDMTARAAIDGGDELGDIAQSANAAIVGLQRAMGADELDWSQLTESRNLSARMIALSECTSVALVLSDERGVVSYVNPAARSLLSRIADHLPTRAREFTGRQVGDVFPGGSKAARMADDESRLPFNEVIDVGNEALHVEISPVAAEDGTFQGAVTAMRIAAKASAVVAAAPVIQAVNDDHVAAVAAAEAATAAAEAAAATATAAAGDAQAREGAQARRVAQAAQSLLEIIKAASQGDFSREVPKLPEDVLAPVGEALGQLLMSVRRSLSQIATSANNLMPSATSLAGIGRDLRSRADETSTRADAAASASVRVAQNVNTVAQAARELSTSVHSLAKSATDAASIASNAMRLVESAGSTFDALGKAGSEIGKVVKVIHTIASQTNLLALNATIEAARAGDAGKGFAVVANEVKQLAGATSNATGDITRQVEAIQQATESATAAINEIRSVINQVSEVSSSIASAVEEQSATTSEMNRNMGEAARSLDDIAQSANGVVDAARNTTEAATLILKAGDGLKELADGLRSTASKLVTQR